MMRGIINFKSKTIIKISNSILIKNDHDDLFILNARRPIYFKGICAQVIIINRIKAMHVKLRRKMKVFFSLLYLLPI
jgi:hypothetical protein